MSVPGLKTVSQKMLPVEKRAALWLPVIYAIRMLGLFLLLPVMALYAEHLDGATPLLVGIAIGIYGLTQACLQIPFGALSDRFGRKQLIFAGLLIFAAGSIIAGISESIYGVILGRALQGAGAIAAAIMALASDLTRDSQRSKIMAAIGLSIGATFIASLVLGPVLFNFIGGSGIFYLSAGLAVLAIVLLWSAVPAVPAGHVSINREQISRSLAGLLLNRQLLQLNIGIFCLHLILTSCFLAIPYYLRDTLGVVAARHWLVYLFVVLGAFVIMLPALFAAERYHKLKPLFLLSILLIVLSLAGLSRLTMDIQAFGVVLILFFAAFNFLEAVLPSLTSKSAPLAKKGGALGIYSSFQFLGAFMGGVLGGWVLQQAGIHGVFLMGSLIALIWLIIGIGMQQPRNLDNYSFELVDPHMKPSRQLAEELAAIRGVEEASIAQDEGRAYLRVDLEILDKVALGKYATVKI